MSLTPAQAKLAQTIGFDERICLRLKEHLGKPLRQARQWGEGAGVKANGLSFQIPQKDMDRSLPEIRKLLVRSGYRAFWGGGNEVLVLKTRDPYEILHFQQTNGANYGIFLPDILARLQEWETRCKLDIIGAASDWVAIEFRRLPKNLCAFAEEIYTFCPDAVEQGVGLKHEETHPEVFAAARKLCPQISSTMRKKLSEQLGSYTEHSEMGIRLLAYELKTTKYVFLWWD